MNLDLNNIIEIPNIINKLILNNVSDNNFYQFKIPEFITELELNGQLTELIIPYHIKIIVCDFLGLKSIICNDMLKHLYCSNNNLESIILPNDIIAIDIADNKIHTIKVKNKLTSILFLDMENNLIEDFDIELPNTMSRFNILGNKNIRIKFINFIFGFSELCDIIDGDYDEVLFEGKLINNEYLRARLKQLCDEGYTYITLDLLEDNEYFYL